jgi:pimeloyl-ACP methyl ester carboxylesterase
LAVQVGIPLLLMALKNRILFFPESSPTPESVAARRVEGDIFVRLIELKVGGSASIPALDYRSSLAQANGPVIVFLHGNAANLALRSHSLARLSRDLGVWVLAVEYPGYGGAPGSPDEESIVATSIAAVDHLIHEGVTPGRIVLYGESLGGAVALATAAQRPVGGVIVEATFSSLSSMARRVHPWLPLLPWMVRNDFPSSRHAESLNVPLLVIHGGSDTIVPPEEGRFLAEVAPQGQFRMVENAGHGDVLETGGATLLNELREAIALWTR